jgi:sigma-B regulation protein RsbU (phosphoserine phosphatase)
VQVAALFQPAYEIGADWYDAFELDGLTVVVVADVCDKGVPSALYMSVFRSLLRLSLLKQWQVSGGDPRSTLEEAVASVNQYMESTHGESAMFATMFVGAFAPSHGELFFLVAGHEAPLVLRGQEITPLPLGGPAVGIFPGARYTVGACALPTGSLLLAYSDGLPDARNPEGLGFGSSRIEEILHEHPSQDWSADDLVNRLQRSVNGYMDGADQFDDLTLLVLRAT